MSKFYKFRQNNSGGSFDRDYNVDSLVFIEATSAAQANEIASRIGIYFDGCETGRDCPCCGDRWYPASDDDAVDSAADIAIYRSGVGMVPLASAMSDGGLLGTFGDCGVVVHRLDGSRKIYCGPKAGGRDV